MLRACKLYMLLINYASSGLSILLAAGKLTACCFVFFTRLLTSNKCLKAASCSRIVFMCCTKIGLNWSRNLGIFRAYQSSLYSSKDCHIPCLIHVDPKESYSKASSIPKFQIKTKNKPESQQLVAIPCMSIARAALCSTDSQLSRTVGCPCESPGSTATWLSAQPLEMEGVLDSLTSLLGNQMNGQCWTTELPTRKQAQRIHSKHPRVPFMKQHKMMDQSIGSVRITPVLRCHVLRATVQGVSASRHYNPSVIQ